MLIDWFTVGAQALNFVVLIWLMRRFLYGPVLRAIDARESRIAQQLADADHKRAEAQAERDAFEQKNKELDVARDALLRQAADDAKAERKRLMDDARRSADAMAASRTAALRRDAEALGRAIRAQTQEEVFAITRQTLSDLAATSLEQRMSEVFIARLRAMNATDKKHLVEALRSEHAKATVRSAFPLDEAQRAEVQEAVNEVAGAPVPLRFDGASQLISGVELAAGGQKIAWTIDGYLTSMTDRIRDLLAETESELTEGASAP